MRRLALGTFPSDAEGNPLPGYVKVGDHTDGRVYVDCADEAPEGAEIIAEGLSRYADIIGTDHAEQVLEATWDALLDGQNVIKRGKQGPARARGDIPLSIEEDLPPHTWLGD